MIAFATQVDSKVVEVGGRRASVRELIPRWAAESELGAARLGEAALLSGVEAHEIERNARWLEIEARLSRGGLSDRELAEAFARAAVMTYGAMWTTPPPSVLARVFGRLSRRELEAELGKGAPPEIATPLLAALARHGELPPGLSPALLRPAPWELVAEVLEALGPDRSLEWSRQVLAHENAAGNESAGLGFVVTTLLPHRHRLDEEGERRLGEKVERLRARAVTVAERERIARYDAGGGPPPEEVRGPDALSPAARAYLLARGVEPKAAGPTLEAAAEERAMAQIEVAGAPELASVEAWSKASARRRSEIARRVGEAAEPHGFAFVGLVDYGGPPIAVFEHEGLGRRASLIPGGRFLRGLSDEEEAVLREASEAYIDEANHYEEHGALLERLEEMRPAVEVEVGPYLLMQSPLEEMPIGEAAEELLKRSLRLPSEAEWERGARGGARAQLTWRGHLVPDERFLAAAEREANAFGLRGVGLLPEPCTDVYAATYEGAPLDGRPRLGEGPRVARGGAAMLSPWQGVGEWQLLCNAVRQSAAEWEYELALRLALGVRLIPAR